MKITYQRNLYKSYMCIEGDEGIVKEHELMILQKYRIPQLLSQQMVVLDGKVEYWFEITGKQQLTDYLSGRQIEVEDMKKILFSLEQLCQKIPEFLLKEEGICLRSELLYVDLADETIYFTYLPFRKREFPEEFRAWMEELLKQIDHQDRACTELAYGIYEKVSRENVNIRELLNVEKRKAQIVPQVSSETKIPEPKVEKEPENVQEVIEFQSNIGKKIWTKGKKYMEDKILGWLGKSRRLPGKKEKQVLQPEIPEKIAIGSEEEVKYPTEVLRVNSEKPMGRLIYQGKNKCGDLLIVEEEFLIGRGRHQVNGRIETDGISRMHAKIKREEGEYYIEDLNSTNGTYLNEELLEYHRAKKLNRNDRVRFGIEEYVFC